VFGNRVLRRRFEHEREREEVTNGGTNFITRSCYIINSRKKSGPKRVARKAKMKSWDAVYGNTGRK
jgi:hypothetical protein